MKPGGIRVTTTPCIWPGSYAINVLDELREVPFVCVRVCVCVCVCVCVPESMMASVDTGRVSIVDSPCGSHTSGCPEHKPSR